MPVFLRAWKKVLEDQRFRSYDWTVKVDMATRSRWKYRKIPPRDDTPGKMGPKGRFSPTVLVFRIFFFFGVGEWKGEVWGMWAISLICSATKLETTWRSQIQGPSGEISKGQKYNLGKFFWTFFFGTLQRAKISHLGKRKIIDSKCHFWGIC